MAAQTFLLPDLGEGLTEAVLVHWLVEVGDTVETDQAIAEVETAKSVVELPTPFAGTVLALHGAEGETIETGAPVLEVGDAADADRADADRAAAAVSGDSPSGASNAVADGGVERVEAEAYRAEERAGSGNVLIGYGTGSVASKGRRRRKAAGTTAQPTETSQSSPVAASSATSHGAAAAASTASADSGPVAMRSPIVRRLAKELGLDPHRIPATGEDGVITRSDVLRAAERGGDARQATPTRPETSGEQSDARGMHGLQVLSSERLSPLRKMVAAKLGRSRAEIPEATVWVDVDFTELWRLRPQMAAEGERPPSVTTLVARFLLLALEQYPLLASRLSEDATELQTFDGVNLGIAVDSERGLSVPVLPRAHELSISELDTALRKVSAEARTGRLEPARLAGSTITFNNYGGFGVDGSAAIINYPEVAIVGMGRVIERPWVVDGEIVARRIAQLSLVFDHRVCDGGYAAGFLRSLVDMIEHPLRVYGRL